MGIPHLWKPPYGLWLLLWWLLCLPGMCHVLPCSDRIESLSPADHSRLELSFGHPQAPSHLSSISGHCNGYSEMIWNGTHVEVLIDIWYCMVLTLICLTGRHLRSFSREVKRGRFWQGVKAAAGRGCLHVPAVSTGPWWTMGGGPGCLWRHCLRGRGGGASRHGTVHFPRGWSSTSWACSPESMAPLWSQSRSVDLEVSVRPQFLVATGGRFYGSRSGECLQHWPALGTGQEFPGYRA